MTLAPIQSKRLHNDTIEEVKLRADLVDVISEYVALKKQGKDYMGLCPFHEEKTPSFSVSPSKRLYYCFGCQTSGDAIKFLMEIGRNSFEDVVAHLANRYNIPLRDTNTAPISPKKPLKSKKSKPSTSAPLPSESSELATLPEPAADIPQRQQRTHDIEIIHRYGDGCWVQRLETPDPSKPKGYDKVTLPWHVNAQGKAVKGKGDRSWRPYRIDEVERYGAGKWVLSLEGEPCVETARSLGLVSWTLQGGSWTDTDSHSAMLQCNRADVSGIVYFPDNDEAGQKKAEKLSTAARQAGMPFVILDPLDIWSDMPDKGDIVDWVRWGQENGMSQEDFIRRLEEELHQAVAARMEEQRLNDPDERLKLEVSAYAKESNPFKKKRLRGQICSSYRLSKQDLEELVEEIERSHSRPKKRSYSASEFFALETEALRWIVPGLLPAGETVLLAALAKCGKTALATDIIYAVLSGEMAIGSQVGVKGKVLFVTSDESASSTRRRLLARGIDLLAEFDNLRIMPHLDISKLSELEAELEDFRPQLVILDSLTTICSELGISEKDPEFARYIYKLKDLLGRYGAAGILTHHENKDPLAKGINKISGSARIPAAVWGIWQLEAVDSNNDKDPRRWLKVKPREGESTIFNLEMNPKDLWASRGIFEFLGEFGDESGEKRSHGERVLALLAKYSPRGLTFKEIDGQLRVGRTLYSILDRLEDRQMLTKRRSVSNPRSWVYAVPDEGDSPPPSGDRDCCVEKTESIDKQRIESIQQQFSSDSAAIQQLPIEQEMLNRQKVEPVSNSGVIQQVHQIQPLEGGEGVCPAAENSEMVQLTIDGKAEPIIQQPKSNSCEAMFVEPKPEQGKSVHSVQLPQTQPTTTLVGKRVFVCEGLYRDAGEGVVESDRGFGCIDVRMPNGRLQTGLGRGTYQILE